MNANYTKRVLESGILREWQDTGSRVALNTQFRNSGTLTDISIFVDDEKRGQGMARRMMQRILFECAKDGFEPDYVYIDTDCSDGFWDHVGFVPNPLYEAPVDGMEYGYEKRVTWERLRQFARC